MQKKNMIKTQNFLAGFQELANQFLGKFLPNFFLEEDRAFFLLFVFSVSSPINESSFPVNTNGTSSSNY